MVRAYDPLLLPDSLDLPLAVGWPTVSCADFGIVPYNWLLAMSRLFSMPDDALQPALYAAAEGGRYRQALSLATQLELAVSVCASPLTAEMWRSSSTF